MSAFKNISNDSFFQNVSIKKQSKTRLTSLRITKTIFIIHKDTFTKLYRKYAYSNRIRVTGVNMNYIREWKTGDESWNVPVCLITVTQDTTLPPAPGIESPVDGADYSETFST